MNISGECVPEALARALKARGYHQLTPVQAAVLEAGARDADLLVSAGTGTGKTVAFGLALAGRLLGPDGRIAETAGPLALVITPTRELARQVSDELAWLYAPTGARVGAFTGGVAVDAELNALRRGIDIVVGSPGRLRDHIERGSLGMADIGCVVLDEVDDLLDMGFRRDIEHILEASPVARQTLMFSASITRSVEALAGRYQRDAIRIDLPGGPDVRFEAITVAPTGREAAIAELLRFHAARGALVFCATRATVADLAGRLQLRGFKVVALSGALAQRERTAALAAMRNGSARVCVATDVMARGIDLPHLDLVIHADLPCSKSALMHRSGRTGRAGAGGLAVLLAPQNRRRQARVMLARAGIAIDWVELPAPLTILERVAARLVDAVALAAPATEAERVGAAQLLVAHEAETIAVALLRAAGEMRPSA